MNNNKQLGICLDHSNALLMELTNNMIISTRIESESVRKAEKDNVDTHEIQGKEQHQHQSAYYKRICDIIMNYHEVLLFGQTDAKNELYNIIKSDHHFNSIKIDLKNTDKMTEPQMHAFVKEFFN